MTPAKENTAWESQSVKTVRIQRISSQSEVKGTNLNMKIERDKSRQ